MHRTLETENERKVKSLQITMKEASKKDAELFNLKTFKKGRKSSINGQKQRADSMISPSSSTHKANVSRFKGDHARSDDESLSPQGNFGSLRLFPTKDGISPKSFSKIFNLLT